MSIEQKCLFGLACFVAASISSEAQVEAVPFLDDSTVTQINLTVAPDDWATLLQNYEADTYYHATFNWNGMAVTAGIRQHGGGSRSPIKPNLDVNFAHYTKDQVFLGLPFIVLKANNEDASNLKEWVSMKLFRTMGFPAPREAPAQLSINGQYFGFYMIVEHEDETFLQRNLGESGGYLYEFEQDGTYEFNNLGTDPSAYAPLLDLKTDQAAPDLQTFCNLVQVINQPPGSGFTDGDFIAALSQYLDPKSFLTYAATENVLAETDALVGGIVGMNNFYLYQFQGTTFYQLIPWDKDMTFSTPTRDVLTGFTVSPGINLLAQRLIAIPEYSEFYLGQVAKAASLLGGTGGWADSQITTEYGIIDDAASNDPNKQCLTNGVLIPCGTADFQSVVQWLHTFLAVRVPFVEPELASDGYQPISGDPVIVAASVVGQGPPQANGPLAPGSLIDLAGANLGASGQAPNSLLPRGLSGTFVSVEGVRTPLVMTSSGQIEAQIPGDLPAGSASIVVSVGGEMSNTLNATLLAANPSILAVTHAATGLAVDTANPIVPGEVLTTYLTGLGAVNGDLAIGSAAPQTPITTIATPQVNLSGTPLEVMFSGLAPGYVGLYQVNAAVPVALPQGSSADLTVSCDAQSATTAPLPLASQ